MHCLANRLPPAGVSLLSCVWKMCQVEGFAHPPPLTQTSTFYLFRASVNFDEMVAEVSFSPALVKYSTTGLKLLLHAACILEMCSKATA